MDVTSRWYQSKNHELHNRHEFFTCSLSHAVVARECWTFSAHGNSCSRYCTRSLNFKSTAKLNNMMVSAPVQSITHLFTKRNSHVTMNRTQIDSRHGVGICLTSTDSNLEARHPAECSFAAFALLFFDHINVKITAR